MSDFKVMEASNDIPNLTKLAYPKIVQPKLDGFFGHWNKEMLSKKGKPFGNKKVNEYFKNLHNIGNYVIQGEVFKKEVPFEELSGVLRKEGSQLYGYKFVAFDCIPLEDWKRRSCKLVYTKRLNLLRSLLNDRVADYKRIIDVPTDIAESPAEALELYKAWLAEGYEGIMIKDPNAEYQWKKVTANADIIHKLKPFKSVDIFIKDVYQEGVSNMAAGVICDFNGKDAKISAGFSHEQKKDMLANPQNYIGKCIEVKYKELTKYGALKHPNFERFRVDK